MPFGILVSICIKISCSQVL